MVHLTMCAGTFTKHPHFWYNTFGFSCIFLLECATIIGNLLVILAICTTRKLRSRADLCVLNLAIVDFLIGLFVPPLIVVQHCADRWPLSGVICQIWIFCSIILFTVSNYSLCALSLHPYIAVKYPIFYWNKRSKLWSLLLIVIVWTCAILILVLWQTTTYGIEYKNREICQVSSDFHTALYLVVLLLLVPVIFLLCTNIITAYTIRSRKYRIKKNLISKRNKSIPDLEYLKMRSRRITTPAPKSRFYSSEDIFNDLRKERSQTMPDKIRHPVVSNCSRRQIREAYKTILIVTGSFLVCWIPFVIYGMHILLPVFEEINGITNAFLWVFLLSTTKNPLIYGYYHSRYRAAFSRLLCKWKLFE